MSASYDIEDESILSTVFKDAFPESWRGNVEFGQYLSELSSYGVEKLNREPDRLAEERAQILEQTQDLAFHNYKTFIQTAECSKEIFQDFQVIERHVDSLLGKLPNLNKECAQFLKEAQEINNSWKMNSVTLQRHTQLLEILEMPQLMDTCVRNGYYEEALELASHVKRLEKKYSHIPVILNIVKEVKNSSQLMLNQLIHQLRSNIQLPACLRVIGYLRRMDVFTEAELRIKFLQARDAWFQGILSNIASDDPYYHITKTIEASRVHLFDIITQYRAIFSDEDPLLIAGKDDGSNEAALFHGWVVHKISQFLTTLQRDLKSGIGGRLDSILGQCMYFGLSFSRVGADFRGLLAPIFQRAALEEFTLAVNMANLRFEEVMQSYTLLGTLAAVPSSALALASQAGGGLQPPSSLLEFNPLAMYCNDILKAFNELRLCAPLTLACNISDLIQQSLMQISQSIVDYHRAEESTFNTQEAEKFSSFCRVYADDLVYFLNKCLQVLFPPAQLAQILGLHLTELSKLGFVGVMDTASIINPIEHLLPAKKENIPLIDEQDDEQDENKAEVIGQTEKENEEKADLMGQVDEEEGSKPALSVQTDEKSENEANVILDAKRENEKQEVLCDTDLSENQTNVVAENDAILSQSGDVQKDDVKLPAVEHNEEEKDLSKDEVNKEELTKHETNETDFEKSSTGDDETHAE